MESNDPSINARTILSSIRGRYVLSYLFVPAAICVIALIALEETLLFSFDLAHTPLAFANMASYILATAALFFAVYTKHGVWSFSLGQRPSPKQSLLYALLAVPMIGVSVLSFFALFLPLSYAWPNEVYEFALAPYPMFFWQSDLDSIAGSFLNIITVVILAPIIEELFFRGFLLNRWIDKIGVRKAVVFSSLIFAVTHADLIGAMIFAVIMCLIYLRTRSLIGPIIVHIANNAFLVGLDALNHLAFPSDEHYSVAEFQSDWWYAVIGAAVGVPWLIWHWREHLSPVGELLHNATSDPPQ